MIGINYAPEETGIAPYTTDLAEHMAGHGWEVTIFTGMPHYPQWEVASEYRASFRSRERRRAVELRRLRHYTPARQSALGRSLYEATFFAQALTQAIPWRPDCVVGIVPSLGGSAAAALHARRFGVPFGLVIQDLVGQAAAQSGIRGGGIAAKPARRIESWVARQAQLVAVVAEGFRPYLEQAGMSREDILHLPNWSHVAPPTRRRKDMRRSLGWPEDQQVALHAGNMGHKQDLRNVVDAARLAALSGLTTRFVLMGDGNDRRRLENLAVGIPNIQFLAPQPGDLFMDVLAAADVLLLNEGATVVDMSLPSKITSYFLAGVPVIAAVPPTGSTAQELLRSGGALIVQAGDPPALLDALRKIAEDPESRQRLVKSARRYGLRQFDRPSLLTRGEQFVSDLLLRGDKFQHANERPKSERLRDRPSHWS